MDINPAREEKNSKGLSRLYILALSIVALLSITGQILIQHSLAEGSKDAYIINMAGRQRMLSQKICKNVLLLESSIHNNKKVYVEELRGSFILWKMHHYGLYHRKEELGLEGTNSKTINQMFQSLDPEFKEMEANINQILANYSTNSSSSQYVAEILKKESSFLNHMNQIVMQYEKEAREKVASLKRTEIALLCFTLLILFLEGMLIFRPAVRKIRKGILALVESEKQTSEMNRLLQITQKELQKTNEVLELKVKQRTKEIEEKNKELELRNQQFSNINKDLENFVYTASHDLKAPINNIEGLVDALSSEMSTEAESANGIVSMMKQSIGNFRNVLKELSDVGKAKVEAGGNTKMVNFKDVLEEIKITSKALIDSSGAEIIADFSEAPSIKFPQKNVRSILYNLISNAIKYRASGRKPLIRIKTEIQDRYVVLTVSDNGMGIKEEDIPKIFSIYTRLTDKVEGTGIGLSLVKNMVDNSGGKISVQSEPGIGSQFLIYLLIK